MPARLQLSGKTQRRIWDTWTECYAALPRCAVRLRNPDGRLANLQAQAPDRFVELARKLGVSIADQEASRDRFPELLANPVSRRMLRHIEAENPPSRVLDDDEDVKNLERGGYDREEVAGNDGFGMIPDKGSPPPMTRSGGSGSPGSGAQSPEGR